MSLPAKLLHPSTLILLAANLAPLAGIVFWGWDIFLLLALYWMESAVIGFWSIAALAAGGAGSARLAQVPFFIVHAGLFMGVHFVFLWTLFSGVWAERVHGVSDFMRLVVIESGLWLPLAALFVSRGMSFVLATFGARLRLPAAPQPQGRAGDPPGAHNPMHGFYARIVVMHLTILFGAFVAVLIGSIAPLMLLIVLKTGIDLHLHLKENFPPAARPRTAAA